MPTSWGTNDNVSLEAKATGYFGTVYKARGIIDQQIFAVKEIPVQDGMLLSRITGINNKKECLLLLQHEARILSQLRKCKYVIGYHGCWLDGPNAQKYSEINSEIENSDESEILNSIHNEYPKSRDFFYIKMDYCTIDLKTWLYMNEDRDLRVPHIFTIFKEMLKGLDFIHSKGIIHRNVKPDIIFLDVEDDRSFHIKIGGFALAISIANKTEPHSYEVVQLGVKTKYLSPEIRDFGNDYDFKTDVYSCGLVFFEVINPSFTDKNYILKNFDQIRNGTYSLPSGSESTFSKEEFTLVAEMTKVNKSERVSAKRALEILYRGVDRPRHTKEPFEKLLLSPKTQTSWGTKDLVSDGEISRGSFGTVYKATTLDGRENFAVKEISVGQYLLYSQKTNRHDAQEDDMDKWIFQLKQEVKILEELKDCHHVVSYYESWFKGPNAENFNRQIHSSAIELTSTNTGSDYFYIRMELCGMDLRKWLIKHNSVESRGLHQSIFRQILIGLEYIHSKGVIHRDIKPENVFLKTINPIHIQIGDFGLSKLVHGDEYFSSGRREVGTEIYRSPEMASATMEKDYNFKTDVYSVGLVFLEILEPELRDSKKRKDLFKKIRERMYSFVLGDDDCLKEEYDLIQKMTRTKDERLSAKEALDVAMHILI